MSDPDPKREAGGTSGATGGMTSGPGSGDAEAASAAAAASPAAPAAPASAAPSSAAASARWRAIGANGQLAIAGAAIVLGSDVLGWALAGWDILGLAHILLMLGAIVAIAVVLLPSAGLSSTARAIALRLSAGIVTAYAVLDLGDMIDELSNWTVLDIVLTIAAAVGAVILLVAAWRLTGGDIVREATALAKVGGRPAPSQIILLGGLALMAGWLFIRADSFRFREQDVLAILVVVVTMAVVWLASGGAGAIRWPVPASVLTAGLAVVVVLLALNWVSRILDELDEFSIVGWIGLVLHVGGAAAVAIGAVLGWQAGRATTSSAGTPAGTTPAGTPPAA